MKIVIVRHGEPNYEIDSLTPKGWREADLLADRLCRAPADAYYVSPLGRAQDTARATLTRLNRQAETLDWLQEFRGKVIGPKTGKPDYAWDFMPQYVTRCPELYDRDRWRENPLIATGRGGEIYDETVRGLDALLERYGFRREGALYRADHNEAKTIVLFCHFAVSMAMLSHLVQLPFYALLHGVILAPTSVTTVVSEERLPGEVWFRCVELGDTSHLYAAGEPVSHYGRYREVYGVDEAGANI